MKNLHKRTFRRGSKTYYNSSLFFPKEFRDDVFALYGFVRTADNFVDAIPQEKEEFFRFQENYRSALSGKTVQDPIIDSFVRLMRRKNFSPEWVDAFFHSMELDLKKAVYNTIEETCEYMYGSAEVIGLFMCRILGLPCKAEKPAALQGRAMQYINFIRDIREDNRLGRRYLPLGTSGLPSLSESDAAAAPHVFTAYIRQEIGRYMIWQQEADSGYDLIPKRPRVPIRTAADMYAWTAKTIFRNPFIVYRKKIKPSRLRILTSICRNFFR